jgi:hypothetical protein
MTHSIDTIGSIYVDFSTYYILIVQKIFVGILSSIITMPTCLSISFIMTHFAHICFQFNMEIVIHDKSCIHNLINVCL